MDISIPSSWKEDKFRIFILFTCSLIEKSDVIETFQKGEERGFLLPDRLGQLPALSPCRIWGMSPCGLRNNCRSPAWPLALPPSAGALGFSC